MADMGEMEMPLPDNTAPMMGGVGPFGGLEMGGMFTTVKVRREQKRGDYKDPGWFKHPQGSVAYEFAGQLPAPARASAPPPKAPSAASAPRAKDLEVRVRKPASGHAGH
jgi:hypothetical protein